MPNPKHNELGHFAGVDAPDRSGIPVQFPPEEYFSYERIEDAPQTHRDVVTMSLGGWGVEEISREIGMTPRQVRKILVYPVVRAHMSEKRLSVFRGTVNGTFGLLSLHDLAVTTVQDLLTTGKETTRARMVELLMRHTGLGDMNGLLQLTGRGGGTSGDEGSFGEVARAAEAADAELGLTVDGEGA